jgi:hypothetical protein
MPDDAPEAPWMQDRRLGGMSPRSRRASWEAEHNRPLLNEIESADAAEMYEEGEPVPEPTFGPNFEPDPTPEFSPAMRWPLPPLTIAEWTTRDLEPPDCLMGDWLTTTSRVLLVAPTGLGKTNFSMALGMAVAAGVDFLHWRGRRPARVLYIDGEMSRRLYRQRIADAVARLGLEPAGFHALSREDLEEMPPLNTPEGQACIERIVAAIGGVDLIIFDSIMCLLGGDMKEGEPWAAVMPWVRSLTKRSIGQVWIHHTGHDASRSYGDKTKEWQLDTVLHMEAAEHPETDVCFNLEFRKARERTPANRAEFQTTKVMLVAEAWATDGRPADHKGHVSPLGLKFFDALTDALAGDDEAIVIAGRRSTTLGRWKAECTRLGLIEPGGKPDSARTLFNRHKRDLIAANHIACNEERVWTV